MHTSGSGWASRYVYDLARALTLVLVGYQADDPPMRYLLEVLEDDRARYPDLRPVYAFAPPVTVGRTSNVRCGPPKASSQSFIGLTTPRAIHASTRHFTLGKIMQLTPRHGDCVGWERYLLPPMPLGGMRMRRPSLLGREDVIRLLATTAPDPSWWPPLSGHEVPSQSP